MRSLARGDPRHLTPKCRVVKMSKRNKKQTPPPPSSCFSEDERLPQSSKIPRLVRDSPTENITNRHLNSPTSTPSHDEELSWTQPAKTRNSAVFFQPQNPHRQHFCSPQKQRGKNGAKTTALLRTERIELQTDRKINHPICRKRQFYYKIRGGQCRPIS